MDNDHFARIISSNGIFKHKFIRSFPADIGPDFLTADCFSMCDTESSKRPGSHWVILAKKYGIVYFGDSLG